MRKLLFLFAVLTAPLMFAQQDALVFFADKEDVAASIANPISILTQEAIDRKAMHNTPIDERDVPVNEAYIADIKNATGITVLAKSKWMNTVYVRGSVTNIENLVDDYAFVTAVEFMDKDLNFGPSPSSLPIDKFLIENQSSNNIIYNYGAAANQTEMIGTDYLHENDFTGEGVLVAVMDNGFPGVMTNPAFSHIIDDNRLLGTYDFVERQVSVNGTGSHGINTSSDIGGFLEGSDAFVGTAPDASFYLFVTEDGGSETPAEEAYWVEALERADSLGVRVVNTSLSYREFDNSNYDHDYEDLDGQTTLGARGGNHAFDKGMIMVNSAGNNGSDPFPYVWTPADAPGVFTVGAVNSSGNYVNFSAIGPTVDGRIKPDVMAQGRQSAVITQGGNVSTSSGTSFSSPIIAGSIASLWQSKPEATNDQVMQAVRESAHLFNAPTDQMGYGIPNFEEAYNALIVLGIEDQLRAEQFALYPNPVTTNLNVSFPEGATEASITIYNVIGKEILTTTITSVKNSINLSQLVSGMYIASVTSNNKTNSFKIIKQ